MKKTVLILAIAFHCISIMMAAPVTRQTAQQKASQFMASHGWSSISSQQPALKVRKAAANSANSLYYVFNNDKGYVIVSGDDRAVDILGYCDTGTYDESTMPEAMKELLAQYAGEIAYLQSKDSTSAASATSSAIAKAAGTAISPMTTSHWGQDAPYNNLCPNFTYDGVTYRSVSGCAATAMAQIMYYYKSPQTTSKAIPAYTTESYRLSCPQLPVTTFDWSNMTDTYSSSSSDAANAAVATLMKYCGEAISMDYGPSSGAAIDVISSAFTTYFNYDPGIKLISRKDYTIADWASTIYKELSASRPVLYTGQSIGGGHAFVCDGYDGNGLFHINWGWDGYCDGYFQLSALNPNTTTLTGASTVDDGYTMDQAAVIGIQPSKSSVTTPAYLSIYTPISASGNYVNYEFSVISNSSCSVSFGLGIEDADGNLSTINYTSNTTLRGGAIYSFPYTLLRASMFSGNGTYKVVPIYRLSSESTWHRIGPSSQYIAVTVNGSSLSIVVHPTVKLAATDITCSTTAPSTTDFNKFTLNITNSGEEYNGNIYAFASSTTTKGSYTGIKGMAIPADTTVATDFYFTIPTTDNLTVWIATDQSGTNVIGQRTFINYDLSIDKTYLVDSPRTVDITIKNNTDADYAKGIQAVLYTNANVKKGTLALSQSIPAGGTATFSFGKVTVPFAVGNYLVIQGQPNELTNTYKNLGTVVLEATSSGISNVATTTADSGAYYNLMGNKVDISKAGKKQIYLHNGKKIIK